MRPTVPLSDLISLLKLRLALAIAASALMGYWLHPAHTLQGALDVFASVLALAAGAGCLNNWQDRTLDIDSPRTRSRPLPAGRMRPGTALVLAWLLLFAGLIGLPPGNPVSGPVVAGALAVCLYNWIYTPLKSRTVFALVPGVLCGVLPPLVGWLAAGGGLERGPIWTLVTVYGLWQPPHYWLRLLACRADGGACGAPPVLALFSKAQLVRVVFVWILALAMALLILPLTFGPAWPILVIVLSSVGLLVGSSAYVLLLHAKPGLYRLLFAAINATVFLATGIAEFMS